MHKAINSEEGRMESVEALKATISILQQELQEARHKLKQCQCTDSVEKKTKMLASPKVSANSIKEVSKPEGTQLKREKTLSSGKQTAQDDKRAERIAASLPAIGTRKGKWLLEERYVVSRKHCTSSKTTALLVREMWLWNGRPVKLERNVTLPLET